MKKISKLIGLFAIAGMTTFLTGCGDDDGGDDDGGVVNRAPTTDAELRAREYTLTAAGAQGQEVLIFPAQGTYQITSGAEVFTGTYSNPTFGENQASVTLNPDNPAAGNEAGVLTMTFSPAGGSGTYAFTPAGQGAVEQGTFTYEIIEVEPPEDNRQFAPETQAQLTAETVTANTSTGPITLTFPNGNSYSLETSEGTETGAFTASREDDTWTLNLTPTAGGAASSLVLTWNAANTGTFIYTPQGEPAESGTFSTESQEPPPPNGTAPASIAGTWNLNVATGPFQGDYIATYNPPNFSTVRASNSEPAGNGTYTYTPNGDQARLVHTYSTPGDQDDFQLNFSTSTMATFTGTQTSGVGGTPIQVSGTMTKQ